MPVTGAARGAGTSVAASSRGHITPYVASHNASWSQKSKKEQRADSPTIDDVPPLNERIKTGVLQRKVIATIVSWKPQHAILSCDKIVFMKDESSDQIVDWIPLTEVESLISEHGKFYSNAGDDALLGSEHHKHVIIRTSTEGRSDQGEEGQDTRVFVIKTEPHGRNFGRAYVFRTNKPGDCHEWVEALLDAVGEAYDKRDRQTMLENMRGNPIEWARFRAEEMYNRSEGQILISTIIVASFVCDVLEAELLPVDGSVTSAVLSGINLGADCFFYCELTINLFAHSNHCFKPFYESGWNIFDACVVMTTIVAFLTPNRIVKLMRHLRIFRLCRIFRRIPALSVIMGCVGGALFPLANAFVLQLMVTVVYAIFATHLFRDYGALGQDLFGNFHRSMFTFFQIMTGDSWASMVVRSLVEEQESSGRGTDPRSIYFFFVSFVLIAGVVLVNIVVAVLLDEFINAMQKEKEKAAAIIREKKEIDAKASRISGVLDPLLQSLSSFNDNNDLTAKVQDLYSRLDADGGGALDFKELNAGLKELALSKPIHLIEDDFDILTCGRTLCNTDGEFTGEQFHSMMRMELKRYAQREIANAMQEAEDPQTRSIILVLKLLSISIEKIEERVRGADPTGKQGPALSHTPLSRSASFRRPRQHGEGGGDEAEASNGRLTWRPDDDGAEGRGRLTWREWKEGDESEEEPRHDLSSAEASPRVGPGDEHNGLANGRHARFLDGEVTADRVTDGQAAGERAPLHNLISQSAGGAGGEAGGGVAGERLMMQMVKSVTDLAGKVASVSQTVHKIQESVGALESALHPVTGDVVRQLTQQVRLVLQQELSAYRSGLQAQGGNGGASWPSKSRGRSRSNSAGPDRATPHMGSFPAVRRSPDRSATPRRENSSPPRRASIASTAPKGGPPGSSGGSGGPGSRPAPSAGAAPRVVAQVGLLQGHTNDYTHASPPGRRAGFEERAEPGQVFKLSPLPLKGMAESAQAMSLDYIPDSVKKMGGGLAVEEYAARNKRDAERERRQQRQEQQHMQNQMALSALKSKAKTYEAALLMHRSPREPLTSRSPRSAVSQPPEGTLAGHQPALGLQGPARLEQGGGGGATWTKVNVSDLKSAGRAEATGLAGTPDRASLSRSPSVPLEGLERQRGPGSKGKGGDEDRRSPRVVAGNGGAWRQRGGSAAFERSGSAPYRGSGGDGDG